MSAVRHLASLTEIIASASVVTAVLAVIEGRRPITPFFQSAAARVGNRRVPYRDVFGRSLGVVAGRLGLGAIPPFVGRGILSVLEKDGRRRCARCLPRRHWRATRPARTALGRSPPCRSARRTASSSSSVLAAALGCQRLSHAPTRRARACNARRRRRRRVSRPRQAPRLALGHHPPCCSARRTASSSSSALAAALGCPRPATRRRAARGRATRGGAAAAASRGRAKRRGRLWATPRRDALRRTASSSSAAASLAGLCVEDGGRAGARDGVRGRAPTHAPFGAARQRLRAGDRSSTAWQRR